MRLKLLKSLKVSQPDAGLYITGSSLEARCEKGVGNESSGSLQGQLDQADKFLEW